jgi:hypothetical protein
VTALAGSATHHGKREQPAAVEHAHDTRHFRGQQRQRLEALLLAEPLVRFVMMILLDQKVKK